MSFNQNISTIPGKPINPSTMSAENREKIIRRGKIEIAASYFHFQQNHEKEKNRIITELYNQKYRK